MSSAYTVSLLIPTLAGDDHEDAAEAFIGVMRDWLNGDIDTLAMDVTDEHGSVFDEDTTKVVVLRAAP